MTSVTLAKVKRVFRTRGFNGLLRAARMQSLGLLVAYVGLSRRREFESNDQVLDFGSTLGNGVIRPFQVRSEILGLLAEVVRLRPHSVLEIGTANGGTLFLLTRVAEPQATIISVDLPGGQFGEGYALWRMPLYMRFATRKQSIHLMRGDSHSDEMSGRVRNRLGNNQLDLVFIDGDHSYEGVKADFELYAPLVRKGGMIAFHDIVDCTDKECQVNRFWNQIKQRYRHLEFIEDKAQGWAGIGLLYVD